MSAPPTVEVAAFLFWLAVLLGMALWLCRMAPRSP